MKRKLFTVVALLVLTFSVSSAMFLQTADASPKIGSGGHGDRGK